jgi:cytochrome c5
MKRHAYSLAWIALGALLGTMLLWAALPAHAYPEYTDRTGEQCTACHVSPAGGGPRTLRGLLWIADGRPAEVPPLPGGGDTAGVLDGPTLFNRFECNRCHGAVGEGGVAAPLNATEWDEAQLTDIIRNGISSMNGYPPETMSDEELAVLIPYIQAIGRGEVQASEVLYQRPLPPARLGCDEDTTAAAVVRGCGGN